MTDPAFEVLASIFPNGWEYTEDHKGLVVTRASFESLDGSVVIDQSFPSKYGFNVTVKEFLNLTHEEFYTIRWNVIVMIVETGTYKHTLMNSKLFTLAISNSGFPYVDDDEDEDYEPSESVDSSSDESESDEESSDEDESVNDSDEESVYDSDSMEL